MAPRSTTTVEAGGTVTYSIPAQAASADILWTVSGGVIVGDPTNDTVTINWGNGSTGTVGVWIFDGSCTEVGDNLDITLYDCPKAPSISGPITVEAGSTAVTYSIPVQAASADILWTVSGGVIMGDSTNATVTINWGNGSNGIVGVWIFDSFCTEVGDNLDITLYDCPEVPSISGPTTIEANSLETYSISTPPAGTQVSWTVIGGTIVGSSGNPSVTILWDDNRAQGTLGIWLSNPHCASG